MAKKSGNKLTSANAVIAMPKEDMDYRARGDCHTLREAEEIMKDRGRHGRAKKHAAKEAKIMAAVAKR